MEAGTAIKTPAEIVQSPPLEIGINDYCVTQADYWRTKDANIQPEYIRAEMEDRHRLLEPVNEQQEPVAQPAMTICIPVALMREDQVGIDRVLDAVHGSQQALGQPVEVVLWANTPDGPDSQKAAERYQELRNSLRRFDESGVQVKTALQVLPEYGSAISQIRADYMEAVAIDTLKEGRESNHPILWLDADTTYLSPNTIKDVKDTLDSQEALFVHATEKFTTEWADGLPMSKRDIATRALMVQEIYRRKYAKKNAQAGKRMNYPEESGLAFTIGTYLKLGGVNTEIPVDEASTLIHYAKELVVNGQISRYHSPLAQSRPRSLPDVPGVLEYLPGARIGMSARRQYEAIKKYGANGVRKAELEARKYTLHTNGQTETEKIDTPSITRADMYDSLAKQKTRYAARLPRGEADLSEKDNRLISKMIKEGFKD